MSYLLDTDFIIGLLRGSRSYWNYVEELTERMLPSVSAITRAEVYAGCHPYEMAKTKGLLDCFLTVGVDGTTADLAGRYIYQFARRGITLHLEDALIGATAANEGLILVTQNVRHFPMLSLGENLIKFSPRENPR